MCVHVRVLARVCAGVWGQSPPVVSIWNENTMMMSPGLFSALTHAVKYGSATGGAAVAMVSSGNSGKLETRRRGRRGRGGWRGGGGVVREGALRGLKAASLYPLIKAHIIASNLLRAPR